MPGDAMRIFTKIPWSSAKKNTKPLPSKDKKLYF